jgi:cob(I)alamin adenosyltransferase
MDIFNQKQSTGKRSDHIVEITRLETNEKTGLVVVITGHGKGKTTTALGIAVRACGHNISMRCI